MEATAIGEESATQAPACSCQLERKRRSAHFRYVLVSFLLLIPCYWQSRLQAADLSSHIYNAWLAELIGSGKAQGLVIAKQTTNILFDLLLTAFFRMAGAGVAQRLSVSIAVLVFAWGAFGFISRVSRRPAWDFMPCIAMLAYGWVFHRGFFNFYISLGLCFAAMAVAWSLQPRRLAAAAPLMALAYVAHALPVVWAAVLLGYVAVARRLSPGRRAYLAGSVILTITATGFLLRRTLYSRGSLSPFSSGTGLDQILVFDGKYYLVLLDLAVFAVLVFITLLRRRGWAQLVGGIPFQLWVLNAAGVFILPSTVLIPGYLHTLTYIAERMSLGIAVCICAVLGAARLRPIDRCVLHAAALFFFVFLHIDEKKLNRFEDRVEEAVATVGAGGRVITGFDDWNVRVNALAHMVDRACLGRCYSYANYEPSTGQFRIRVTGPNPIVAATYFDSWRMQTGEYVVQDRDLPLYMVDLEPEGRMVIRVLKAGARCGSTYRKMFADLPDS